MEILEKKNRVSQLTKTLEGLYRKLYIHTHTQNQLPCKPDVFTDCDYTGESTKGKQD